VQSRIQEGQQGDLMPNTLRLRIQTNLGEEVEAFAVTADTQRDVVSLGVYKGVEWIQVHFATESSPNASAIDVERVVLGALLERPRTR
jgi:hypothetical protein